MNDVFLKKIDILLSSWEVKNMTLKDLFSQNDKNILYFYPKDDTPWCTLENKDFSFLKNEFEKLWVKLFWISKDSIESHKTFKTNHTLEVDLISDEDLELHKYFKTYWEKNNYWKIVFWVIRSTFLIDNNCDILKSWKSIKAKNHAQRILDELKKNSLWKI